MVLLGWVQIDTRHVVQGSYYLTLWPCAQPTDAPVAGVGGKGDGGQ